MTLKGIPVKRLLALAVGVLLTATGATAQADGAYPQRPIKLIVPAAPGGGADFIARLLSPSLTASLGQAVVIENKSGASGTIAAGLVAKSEHDGYTLLMAQSTSMVIAPHIYKHLPYDPLKDLTPVALAVRVPNILVVNPSVPAKTIAEFIALAKAKPLKLSYGSSGYGSPSQLGGKMFEMDAGVKMVHVPYRGIGPAVTALLGNQIQAMFAPITTVLPLIKAHQLRALGVTTAGRLAAVPDIPTIAGSGLPGYEISSWFGVFVPARTPAAIITRLNQAVVQALKDPKITAAIAREASEPGGGSPTEFAAFVHAQDAKFAAIVKSVGPKVD